MSDFIGKTISLISTNDVRYVGVLTSISSTESTVSLAHVVSYGTEGRRGGQNELYPAPQMIPELVFKGSDVKDLKVMQDFQVPPQQQQPHLSAAPPQRAPQAAPKAEQRPEQRVEPKVEQPKQSKPPQTVPQAAPQAAPHTISRAAPQAAPQASAARAPSSTLEAFDFGATHTFQQKKEAQEAEEAPTYDKKKSFFDELSSGTEPEGRAQERGLNMETFGQTGNIGRGGRRGRGRGRGGRGRGRGRGSS